MEFPLNMYNFPPKCDGRIIVCVVFGSDFGYIFDLEKSDSEALKIVGFGANSRISALSLVHSITTSWCLIEYYPDQLLTLPFFYPF